VTNLKLKLNKELTDENLLSLIFYQTQIINPGKPFGPGWFRLEIGKMGVKMHREYERRKYLRLERKGYIRMSGLKRHGKGKAMASYRITELGFIHAGLKKLEKVFEQEDELGRAVIFEGILAIHRELTRAHPERYDRRYSPLKR